MQKELLVRTDSRSIAKMISPPLGILSLASALREWAGHRFEVEVLDMRLSRKPFRELARRLHEGKPDIVGFSTLSVESGEMHQAAGIVKRNAPYIPVIAGGPHATIFYDRVLEDPNIDYAVVGEGERSFAELADVLAEGGHPPPLPGVAHRRDGEIVFPGSRDPIEDVDSIPFPAWDLIDINSYSRRYDFVVGLGKGRNMGIFTSRGCPYRCVYCHNIFGKKYRARSPESVIEEIGLLVSRHGVREIQIFDDTFNLDRERVLKIARGIVAEGWNIRLAFPNGVRADLLDEEVLTWLRRAGTYYLVVAVETASPRLQKRIGKNLDPEKAREAIRIADRMGYFVKGFFMLGFPGETKEECEATIRFACDAPLCAASFFIVVPFERTPIRDLYGSSFNEGAETNFFHYFCTRSPIDTGQFGESLKKIQKKAYQRFYLRSPRRIVKSLARVPSRFGFIVSLVRGFGVVWSIRV